MYEAMPAEQFKTLIMAMLKYKYGDEKFADSIEDPMVRAIFAKEKVEIDRNEEHYEEIRKKRAEAGGLGGRPKKKEQVKDEEPQVEDYTPKEEQEEQVDDKLQSELKEVYQMYIVGNKMYELRLNRMKDKYGIPYLKLKEMMDEVWETT